MSTPRPHPVENRLAAPMFCLALFFLLLLAILFHGRRDPEIDDIGQQVILILLGGLWPAFWVESALRYLLRPRAARTPGRLVLDLVPALLPPLRLGVRGIHDPESMWLPWLGWQKTGYRLLDYLQRTSGAPMIIAAFLILPLMVLEYGFEEQVRTYPALAVTLQLGTGFIWLAFAFEYIVLSSAAPRMLRYCVRHWLDFAIVVLPVIEYLPFARVLRLARLMRLEQLGKLGRLYRLRGLAMKAWRAILLLNLFHRLLGRSLERRLAQLEAQLLDKQHEIEFLQSEIALLRERIAAQKGPRPVSNATTDGAAGAPAAAEPARSTTV